MCQEIGKVLWTSCVKDWPWPTQSNRCDTQKQILTNLDSHIYTFFYLDKPEFFECINWRLVRRTNNRINHSSLKCESSFHCFPACQHNVYLNFLLFEYEAVPEFFNNQWKFLLDIIKFPKNVWLKRSIQLFRIFSWSMANKL